MACSVQRFFFFLRYVEQIKASFLLSSFLRRIVILPPQSAQYKSPEKILTSLNFVYVRFVPRIFCTVSKVSLSMIASCVPSKTAQSSLLCIHCFLFLKDLRFVLKLTYFPYTHSWKEYTLRKFCSISRDRLPLCNA